MNQALVTFFYLLGRDELPLGAVEAMLKRCVDEPTTYSNPDLENWAKRVVERMTNCPE